MVDPQDRRNSSDADYVQDVGVRRVPRPPKGPVPLASRDGVLRFGAVRIHNAHLQSGKLTRDACGVCSEGLEGAVAAPPKVEEPAKADEVAEGGGDHEEGDTSSPYRYGAYPS